MTKPCGNCPFRRDGFIPLRTERVEEITEGMLSRQGISFACHKTTGHNDEGDTTIVSSSKHCAGALIFAEKNDNATQMMRICERIGMYDRTKLEPAFDVVFDDIDEMIEAHEAHPLNRWDRKAGVKPAKEVGALVKRPKHKHDWKITKWASIPGTKGNSGKGRTGPRVRVCACGATQQRDSKARKWVAKEAA